MLFYVKNKDIRYFKRLLYYLYFFVLIIVGLYNPIFEIVRSLLVGVSRWDCAKITNK